jgi:tetratricopeptide (TPR) repeat protein
MVEDKILESNHVSRHGVADSLLSLRPIVWLLVAGVIVAAGSRPSALAAKLDEMSLERWAKLREVERYQLQIAEDYYRKKDWKVAAAEYEKYLTLYERSEAGSYAQLKWSLCQLQLRKANTAIKEGFQSVIDYWPDSPDAVAAAYYIGRTYKDIGQLASAKKAYRPVLEKDPNHLAVIRAMVDLVAIAEIEKDRESQVELWRKLTFDVERTKESTGLCSDASRQLANHYFMLAAFNEGQKALATTFPDDQLPAQVAANVRGPLQQLTSDDQTRTRGEKLASLVVAYLRGQVPSGRSDPEQETIARQCWCNVADVYAAARLDAKVEDTYSQIMKTFGTDDETLGRLAGWQKSVRRFDAARQTYRRFQDRVEGLNQVAISFRDAQNYDQAVATFRELVDRDADNQVRWNAEIASTYYYYARKYDQAITVYKELLALDPDHADKWRWQVACAYRDAAKHKEAIGWYRQCTNFPTNYMEMAHCQRRLKQFKEAIALYMQVAGGHPKSAPSAMLYVAYTLEESGQKERAIKGFQQVCRQFPKDSHASRAHAHLQNKYNISITLGGAKDE